MEQFFLGFIIFGGFLLFFVIMCCIRLFVYLTSDKRFLCFKSKAALRRRRIQLSFLPEVSIQRATESLGYTAAPDENINEFTICQPYVYEDGRSTGMRMIANLPIAIAFRNGGIYPPESPNNYTAAMQNSEDQITEYTFEQRHDELFPPNYTEAHCSHQIEEKIVEQPPPSYDECMKTIQHLIPETKTTFM